MNKLLHQLLRLSAFVIESGGEISRVEEGLSRMTAAYGAEESHVYATTSQVSVTVVKDGEVRTQMCRPHRVSLDLDRLDRANALVRRICAEMPDADEIAREIDVLRAKKVYPVVVTAPMTGAISAAFAAFFGARTVAEVLVALVVGLLLGFLARFLARAKTNRILNSFLLSFLASLFAFLATRAGLVPTPDFIVIGYIMNLIPGVGFTGALRDLFVGDLFTGMSRILEAVLLAAAIAFGFVLTMLLFGGAM